MNKVIEMLMEELDVGICEDFVGDERIKKYFFRVFE